MRQIYGQITYGLDPEGFGIDATYEIAEIVGTRIVNALREYLDAAYPGNEIDILTTTDTGAINTMDYIMEEGDDGDDNRHDIMDEIEEFLRDAFSSPKYWEGIDE